MSWLPCGWSSAPLGEVCTVVSGATPKTANSALWGGDVAWVTPDDLSEDHSQTVFGGRRTLTGPGLASCSARLFPAGSVMFSSRAPIGYVAIAGVEMATNQGCKTAVPPASIASNYLYWHLVWSTPEIESRASGTTFREISGKRFAETMLRWPRIDEQRRIVEILEDHLSRLDAADAYLEAVAVRSTALRWRRVHQLLSEAGGTELSLGALAKSIKNGIFVSRPGQTAVGVPILRIGALRQLNLDVTDLRYTGLNEEDVAARGALLRADDLLFTRYNGNPKYVGACAVVPPGLGPITYPDKLIRVIVDLGIALPGFVALACSVGAARRQIQAAVKTTSGQAGVSGADLRKVLVSVPSIATQQVIIQAASETSEAGKRMGEAAEAGTRRSAALRRALVHAAFTGRLTGRA